jgi:hypothetical protein
MHKKAEKVGESTLKPFDVKALIAKGIHTIKDPELGEIKYGDLTLEDGFEIANQKDTSDQDKALLMIAKMLVKGGQKVTVEDLKNLPVDKGTRLINLLTAKTRFLPTNPTT